MRYRTPQLVVLGSAYLMAGCLPIYAQHSVAITPAGDETKNYCFESSSSSSSGLSGERPSEPETSIVDVNFSGSLQMPISDRRQIADSIKRSTYAFPMDGVIDAALERVRVEWQNRGYFKVMATGEEQTLSSSPVNQRIALNVHVFEGVQYNLGRITFKNNKALGNIQFLRDLFPIKDGDVFSREKIAEGLENLRKAYSDAGYINFTSVPDTEFDDQRETVDLSVDVDEGKRFYVSSFDILGLDEPTRQQLLAGSPLRPGQIYNARILDLFLQKYYPVLKINPAEPGHIDRRLDERAGTVAITLFARPCPAE